MGRGIVGMIDGMANRCGNSHRGVELCSRRPCVQPGRAASQQRVEASYRQPLSCGNGDEYRCDERTWRLRRVARISVSTPAFSGLPADDDAQSGLMLCHDTQHDSLEFSAARAERVPQSERRSNAAPRPRHGISAGPGQRDHASARGIGHQRISTMARIMNALASSRSRSPSRTPRQYRRSAIPSITPGPACSSSHSSSGPSVA